MAARRRLILMLAGLACLAGLGLGGFWILQPDSRPGVNKANCDRIEKGMTLLEVQELFGQQGGFFDGYVGKPAHYWENEDRSFAIVLFDDDRKVATVQWGESPESIGAKLRRLVRWPWW